MTSILLCQHFLKPMSDQQFKGAGGPLTPQTGRLIEPGDVAKVQRLCTRLAPSRCLYPGKNKLPSRAEGASLTSSDA